MTWSVIIPSARADNLLRSLQTVFAKHQSLDPKRVIVVDDGAREGAESQLPAGVTWVSGVRPFVFARNVNLGIDACVTSTAVVMGDDVEILSENGFDLMDACLTAHPGVGILSAAVRGTVGNFNQRDDSNSAFRFEKENLAFIAVAIPRAVWKKVGPLDEQFVGYGCEDNDYCWRVQKEGFAMAITNTCVVRHDGSIPSTFRTRKDFAELFEVNKDLLRKKWPERAVH